MSLARSRVPRLQPAPEPAPAPEPYREPAPEACTRGSLARESPADPPDVAQEATSGLIGCLTDWQSELRSLSPVPEVASCAARALANLGRDAVPGLILALESDRADQRMGAAMTLSLMGEEGSDAVPALARHLEDEDREVRMFSVLALENLGDAASSAAPALLRLAGTDDAPNIVAAGVLLSLRMHIEESQSILRKSLSSEHGIFRRLAVEGLARGGEQVVSDLESALEDDDPPVRIAAAMALATRAPGHPATVPALEEIVLGHPDPYRSQALVALADLPDQSGSTGLARIVGNEEAELEVRILAAGLLLRGEPASGVARSMLRRGLGHPDPSSCQAALVALQAAGTSARPRLEEAMTGGDLRVLTRAAALLLEIEPRSEKAFRVVDAALEKAEPDGRIAVCWGLSWVPEVDDGLLDRALRDGEMKLPPRDPERAYPMAREALGQALLDEHSWVRFNAADALLRLEPGRADAYSTLVDLLGSADDQLLPHVTRCLTGAGAPVVVQLEKVVLQGGEPARSRARAILEAIRKDD